MVAHGPPQQGGSMGRTAWRRRRLSTLCNLSRGGSSASKPSALSTRAWERLPSERLVAAAQRCSGDQWRVEPRSIVELESNSRHVPEHRTRRARRRQMRLSPLSSCNELDSSRSRQGKSAASFPISSIRRLVLGCVCVGAASTTPMHTSAASPRARLGFVGCVPVTAGPACTLSRSSGSDSGGVKMYSFGDTSRSSSLSCWPGST
mmetsp:Transcript_26363/g.52944  ORF Transcript_26363/g.52944 Transcript_26363/m.52944 type:complete len:205 (+) Transcript_26363:929-1543(+)